MPSSSLPPKAPIEHLLAQQQQVLEAFEAARDVGISTAEGVQRLRDVEELLVEHLAVVDTAIYPLLRRLAVDEPRVRRALMRAAEEEDTAARVDAFFTHHARPNAPDFFTEWGSMYVAVQKRFRLERTVLLPALRASKLADDLALPVRGRLWTGRVGRMTSPPKREDQG